MKWKAANRDGLDKRIKYIDTTVANCQLKLPTNLNLPISLNKLIEKRAKFEKLQKNMFSLKVARKVSISSKSLLQIISLKYKSQIIF